MTNEQFELLAECYRRRYGRLYPGKDEPARGGQDSGDPENIEQVIKWQGGASVSLAIHDLLTALLATADRNAFVERAWTSDGDELTALQLEMQLAVPQSSIPCALCDGPVHEFTVDNDAWNRIVRRDGPEGDTEYLCINCFGVLALERVDELRRALNAIADGDCPSCGCDAFARLVLTGIQAEKPPCIKHPLTNANREIKELRQRLEECSERSLDFSKAKGSLAGQLKALELRAERLQLCLLRIMKESPDGLAWAWAKEAIGVNLCQRCYSEMDCAGYCAKCVDGHSETEGSKIEEQRP